jgi:hypothetical protein
MSPRKWQGPNDPADHGNAVVGCGWAVLCGLAFFLLIAVWLIWWHK